MNRIGTTYPYRYRYLEMYRMFLDGATYDDLVSMYHLSRQKIGEILSIYKDYYSELT